MVVPCSAWELPEANTGGSSAGNDSMQQQHNERLAACRMQQQHDEHLAACSNTVSNSSSTRSTAQRGNWLWKQLKSSM
jgi:hypothetical protein